MSLLEREINYLGALLHDIGKLIWRAQNIKAGDTHEKLGEEFIRENLGKIKCLSNDIEEIIKAANRMRGKIWSADVIAAQEREDSEDMAPRRYLEAISNRVEFDSPSNKPKSANYWYYKPQILSINRENFPHNFGKNLEQYEHDEVEYINSHKELLDKFKEEIRMLEPVENFRAFVSTFYYLMEKYTSKVLSAGYLSHPDISLFDHSRITAALSVCFEEGDENKECLLVKGDLSGIQSYIYNGITEMTDIAKRLRGRSFTIQLLSELITNLFLEQLNLFEANLIYNGGGHFLLLTPNNPRVLDVLNKLENRVNESLFYEYTGRIYLILETVECSGKEFINDFRNIYIKLDNKLNERKKKKGRENFVNLFSNSFTAKEFREKEKKIEDLEKSIGSILPKSNFLVLSKKHFDKSESSDFKLFHVKGIEYVAYLCKNIKAVETLISNLEGELNRIISINETNFLKELDRSIFKNSIRGFRFIGNYLPLGKNDEPISFEDLAEVYSKNYPLLGIMRMDVDNLGAIFSFGLREKNELEKKYTPSRVANLSRELNWFFTGYINEIAKEFEIYIAYSGGDDVFVVGNWYQVVKFSSKLRNELNEFVCKNQHLSASAGIIFTKPNFPISQSALLAGAQEKLAKNTKPRLEKNKVGVLDIQLTWEEFDEFITYADELVDFLNTEEGKKVIPRSFLYNLYSVTNDINDRNGKISMKKLIRAKRMLHYMFARRKVNANILEQDNKGKEKVNKLLYKLAVKLLLSADKEKEYIKIKFPLTLALYKTRR